MKVYPPRFCCLARRKNGENIGGAEPRIELTSWRQREVLRVSLPGSLVLRLACALESPGEFEKNMMPGSVPRGSDLIGLGCGLAMGIFKTYPEDSDVQQRLRNHRPRR